MIFFIYVYQRYIYRVDPKRVNEFGTSQEMIEQNGSVGGDQKAIKDKPVDDSVKPTEEKTEKEKKEDWAKTKPVSKLS